MAVLPVDGRSVVLRTHDEELWEFSREGRPARSMVRGTVNERRKGWGQASEVFARLSRA